MYSRNDVFGYDGIPAQRNKGSSESSEIIGKAHFDQLPTAWNIANCWKLLTTPYDKSIFVFICTPIALSQIALDHKRATWLAQEVSDLSDIAALTSSKLVCSGDRNRWFYISHQMYT